MDKEAIIDIPTLFSMITDTHTHKRDTTIIFLVCLMPFPFYSFNLAFLGHCTFRAKVAKNVACVLA